MAWSAPHYSRTQVDKAGRDLLSKEDSAATEALQVVENWRAAHNFPMNMFQVGLRKRATAIDSDSIVAQRIKRMSSIRAKLERYPSTRLSQMQDIGGCRAVLSNVRQVQDLVRIYKNGDVNKPTEEKGKITDYIERPKPSGYRGVHIVYKYAGSKEEFKGLNIEIQIRSINQHAWATAVETVGLFTSNALKSNKGNTDWLRFFAVMGTAVAHIEKSNLVPNTPLREDWAPLLMDYIETLDALNALKSFGSAITEVASYQHAGDQYFLLVLSPETRELKVWGYAKHALDQASQDYAKLEHRIKGTEQTAVLVSVNAISDLKRAYPNYYLDTSIFLDLVNRALR